MNTTVLFVGPNIHRYVEVPRVPIKDEIIAFTDNYGEETWHIVEAVKFQFTVDPDALVNRSAPALLCQNVVVRLKKEQS